MGHYFLDNFTMAQKRNFYPLLSRKLRNVMKGQLKKYSIIWSKKSIQLLLL